MSDCYGMIVFGLYIYMCLKTYLSNNFQVMYLEKTIFQKLMWQVSNFLFKTLPYFSCDDAYTFLKVLSKFFFFFFELHNN